jgi:threonyl-tRNA synthetase
MEVGVVESIRLRFPDGSEREVQRGITGLELVRSLSEDLAQRAVGLLVNGVPYDLSRPLTEDAEVRVLTYDDPEGQQIFWHSSAHLMAEALEALYPGIKFAIGPPIEQGFYYDVELPEGVKLSSEDLPRIEEKMRELAQRDVPFERIEVSWEEAVEHYRRHWNPYKLEILEGLRGQPVTFYPAGELSGPVQGHPRALDRDAALSEATLHCWRLTGAGIAATQC